jgi:hypothetical protein
VDTSPRPLAIVEFIRRQRLERQRIVTGGAGRGKGFFPPLARRALRGDDEPVVFEMQFDSIAKAALFDQGFRNANSPRITNANKLDPHFAAFLRDYIVTAPTSPTP